VTSRSALAGTDSIDWGQFGDAFAGVPNPSTATSAGGVSVTVSQAGGDFERRDQSSGGWNGNFSDGEKLLWTRDGGNGPMTLDFGSHLVNRGGANIQRDIFGDFTATIEALDAMGNVLASFTEAGTSNDHADGSAIFIGIKSDNVDIAK